MTWGNTPMTHTAALIGLAWLSVIGAGVLAWGTWRNRERVRRDDP